MQIKVKGRNIDLTDALTQYAEKKMEKIEHFFHNIQKIDIELEVSKVKEDLKKQIAKATVWASGTMLHAVEATEDMYASIDAVVDKLDHQIKKYKEKLVHEKRRESAKVKSEINHSAETDQESPQR